MSPINAVLAPGSADAYQKIRVQLAMTYDMSLFGSDFAAQEKPLYGFHIWGPCPRCGHPSSGLVPVKYLPSPSASDQSIAEPTPEARERVTAARAQAGPQEAESIMFEAGEIMQRPARQDFKAAGMTCRCPVAHDLTNGNAGCGAEWIVAFEYVHESGRENITLSPVGPEVEARIWVAADAVAASVAAAGQTAMGVAAKWVAVLSSVVAVITLGGVLGGLDTIQQLPICAQVVLGAATLVALFATVCMIYQGNIAGNGYPALKAALSEHSLIQADIEPLRDAQASIERLNCAKNWAIVTISATLVAVGLFLFVPSADAGHVKVKYTDTDSIVHQTGCGVLSTDASNNPKSFTPDHGPKITFTSPKSVEIDAC